MGALVGPVTIERGLRSEFSSQLQDLQDILIMEKPMTKIATLQYFILLKFYINNLK